MDLLILNLRVFGENWICFFDFYRVVCEIVILWILFCFKIFVVILKLFEEWKVMVLNLWFFNCLFLGGEVLWEIIFDLWWFGWFVVNCCFVSLFKWIVGDLNFDYLIVS